MSIPNKKAAILSYVGEFHRGGGNSRLSIAKASVGVVYLDIPFHRISYGFAEYHTVITGDGSQRSLAV